VITIEQYFVFVDKGFAGLAALGYAEALDGMIHSICPHTRRCRREVRDGQKWCAIKVVLYLGRAMADTAPAARPGCDKLKTSCLIP
jgi:hypothetical protein